MRIQHFVLTRFNVRFAFFINQQGHGEWPGADPAYLDCRLAFFEKYCLPAMKRQTVPFRWLVFFSSLTPETYKERVRAYVHDCPSFEPVFVKDEKPIEGSDMQETFYRYVGERLDADAEWVVTTRIDNDDAFNVQALAWIRQSAEETLSEGRASGAFLVVLRHGNVWLLAHDFTQACSWMGNHFLSLVCPRSDRRQVLSFDHRKVKDQGMPVVVNPAKHAWLEIVNGTNLGNGFRPSFRACRMTSRELRDNFAIDADLSRMRGLRFYWLRYLPARISWRLLKMAKRIPFLQCGEEFIRYAVVGGVAFVADFATMVLAQECFLGRFAHGVYLSVMLGFFAGLAVNYVLSLWFVFTRDRYADRGRNVWSFLVFGIIGAAGLGWTELGMWLGVQVLSWNYMFVKIIVTGAVLAWNYLGRKWLVFSGARGGVE